VYVAFKDTRLYDKTEYQWLTDWYFFQRTDEECRQLFASAGYDMSGVTMTRDPIGVIINFICRDHQAVAVRVDEGTDQPATKHVELSPHSVVHPAAGSHPNG
jgi:hypothetical protein